MIPFTGNQPENGKTYVDDVFSAYTYTGNGSTQNIVNGIDLAGKGGLVWIKSRTNTAWNALFNTTSGVQKYLSSNVTDAEATDAATLTAFNSNGFSLGSSNIVNNGVPQSYIAWCLREAPKFFDVVTYTGDGTTQRMLPHVLGCQPGMVMVKAINGTSDWNVRHIGAGIGGLKLNLTDAKNDAFSNYNTEFTTSQFTVWHVTGGYASFDTNASGVQYVAYLFAHDTSADGVIQCGSFTTDGSGNADVPLGWELQWGTWKNITSSENWYTMDSARGLAMSGSVKLSPNLSNTEGAHFNEIPTATGLKVRGWTASSTYVGVFIRRPNKPPTSGTQVYQGALASSSGTYTATAGFPVDLAIYHGRLGTSSSYVFNRLCGSPYLDATSTSSEAASSGLFDSMTAFKINVSGDFSNYMNWLFRRAPLCFDEVCYTGTGSATTIPHNLGVVPELMIFKSRSTAVDWPVYSSAVGNASALFLNTTDAPVARPTFLNSTSPTASVFSVGTMSGSNANGATYVWYGFATLPGISKVFSYTGNGSSQTINCGFTTGARFVLIKRTDSTGDWYVWDSVRGIVAGNDPHLSLNTTAAEVTTDDSVDTDTTGFIVNQLAATNINVNNATYIGVAFS